MFDRGASEEESTARHCPSLPTRPLLLPPLPSQPASSKAGGARLARAPRITREARRGCAPCPRSSEPSSDALSAEHESATSSGDSPYESDGEGSRVRLGFFPVLSGTVRLRSMHPSILRHQRCSAPASRSACCEGSVFLGFLAVVEPVLDLISCFDRTCAPLLL